MAVEGPEGLVERRRRGEWVAGRKHVAGVEAHAHPLLEAGLRVDRVEHRSDLLERGTEARALARRRLDENPAVEPGGHRQGLRDSRCRPGDRHLGRLLAGSAGVRHDPRDSEAIGSPHLLGKGGDRLLAEGGVGRGGIDQVGVVGHDEFQPCSTHGLPEGISLDLVERRDGPLVDVASEHLQAVAAGLDGPLDGPRETSGDRVVGPEGREVSGGGRAGHRDSPGLPRQSTGRYRFGLSGPASYTSSRWPRAAPEALRWTTCSYT